MSRIILIGCGKKKTPPSVHQIARDLYTGPLFRARRGYAELSLQPWYIVSARHGLLRPRDTLLPYDFTIKQMPPAGQHSRALQVAVDLLSFLNPVSTARRLRQVNCELHMGADYAELLMPAILAGGMSYSWPVMGMSQGEQMHYYKSHYASALAHINKAGTP